MKYKLIIFDLDGTLLNTITDLNLTLNIILDKYDSSKVSLETTRKNIGYGRSNLIKKSLIN